MNYRKLNAYGSDIHVIEFNPTENHSQLVKSPTGRRQPLKNFTHKYYTDRGYKVKAAINFSYFDMDNPSSLFLGLFARDSGFVDGIPNNGHEVWLTKLGQLNVKQLNTLGVSGIGNDWIWGGSLAYSLVLDGKKAMRNENGFNFTAKVERTCFGQKADKTIVIIAAKYLNGNESAEVMLSLGCINAVMGDGGGSTEMIVDGNQVFPSTRNKGTALLIFSLPETQKPPISSDKETEYKYRVAHVKARNNTRYQAGMTVQKKYLTIHTTNNYNETANAEMHRKYLETTANFVSFALCVDEKETIELTPLNEPSYSAGDGGDGEHNTYDIAMEICCHKLDSEGKLDEQVYRNAVETAAKIINECKVTMIQHRDVPERSWKNCPHAWILDYARFKKDVEKRVSEITGKSVAVMPATPTKLYRVQVGAFGVKENAENLMKELKSKGYAVILKEE